MVQPADRIFEQWLVLQSQSGDQEALRILIGRWNKRLVRHAMRYTNDVEGAKDAAQESWIAIIRNLHTVKDARGFGAWALRIAGRKAIDWTRKAKRLRVNADHHANTVHNTEPYDESPDERVEVLRRELRNLPDNHRHVLTMFYLEGYAIKEIAAALNVSVGTVKSRLFHAREHLKKQIKNSRHEKTV